MRLKLQFHLTPTMKRLFAALAFVCLPLVSTASAQTPGVAPALILPGDSLAPIPPLPASDAVSPAAQPAAVSSSSRQLSQPSLITPIGGDFARFFSKDTAKMVGLFSVAALLAHPEDRQSVETSSAALTQGVAHVGNSAGGLFAQAGAGLATYFVGRAAGNRELAAVGGEVFRAQLITQSMVQAAKFTVQRQRPDGSNSLSFPSGHTASAFATATVLQRNMGWKVGIPAYAFASAVGASRMASSKHYLSDVLVGAGIGIAAGRAVSFNVGREKFDVGAAPTAGGAVVTFTRH